MCNKNEIKSLFKIAFVENLYFICIAQVFFKLKIRRGSYVPIIRNAIEKFRIKKIFDSKLN